MKTVNIYTDGACRGNPGLGGWGVLIEYENITKEYFGGEKNTTNNNTLFYRTKLRSPLVLTANSSGYLDIGIKANMTVEATFPKPGVLGLYAQPMTFDLEFISQ